MKKRILAVLMAAAMTAGLTACGGGGGNTETSAQAPAADEDQTNHLVVHLMVVLNWHWLLTLERLMTSLSTKVHGKV